MKANESTQNHRCDACGGNQTRMQTYLDHALRWMLLCGPCWFDRFGRDQAAARAGVEHFRATGVPVPMPADGGEEHACEVPS